MSSSQVLAFIEKLSTDSALRQQVSLATKSTQVIKIAESAGFTFTIDEFRSVAASMSNRESDELNEEELDAVVGGVDTTAFLPFYHAAFGFGKVKADINHIMQLP